MSTEGCVAQKAIAGKEKGFKVTVVPSACATADADLEQIALSYLECVVGVRIEPQAAIVETPSGFDDRTAGYGAANVNDERS